MAFLWWLKQTWPIWRLAFWSFIVLPLLLFGWLQSPLHPLLGAIGALCMGIVTACNVKAAWRCWRGR